jgi:hypothetical protein
MLAADRRLLDDRRRFRLGDFAAHILRALHHRPNLILGLWIVPYPRNQPSAEILSLGSADIATVQDDFSAAFSWKIKIFAPAPLHGVTNARARKRPTSTATPPLLIPGFQLRSNSSTASTLSGAKMR